MDSSTITQIESAEKERYDKSTKIEKRLRKKELSNPANISPRLCSLLAERIPPENVVAKIESLMEAEYETKGGNLIPDNGTQIAACKLYLAYYEGLPIQRQEILNHHKHENVNAEEELLKKMAESPALRKQMAKDMADRITQAESIEDGLKDVTPEKEK